MSDTVLALIAGLSAGLAAQPVRLDLCRGENPGGGATLAARVEQDEAESDGQAG